MRKRELFKRISIAQENIRREMAHASSGGLYARGMSTEGFAGGYRQALSDITLLLNDAEPNDDRHYWRPPAEGGGG